MEISLKYPLYISFYFLFSYKKSNHIVVVKLDKEISTPFVFFLQRELINKGSFCRVTTQIMTFWLSISLYMSEDCNPDLFLPNGAIYQ